MKTILGKLLYAQPASWTWRQLAQVCSVLYWKTMYTLTVLTTAVHTLQKSGWVAVSYVQIKTCSHLFFAWQWFQPVELDLDRAPLAWAAAAPLRRCEYRLVTSRFNHTQVSLPSKESSWWLTSGEECWECSPTKRFSVRGAVHPWNDITSLPVLTAVSHSTTM